MNCIKIINQGGFVERRILIESRKYPFTMKSFDKLGLDNEDDANFRAQHILAKTHIKTVGFNTGRKHHPVKIFKK